MAKVLIAEDTTEMRMLLSATMEAAGHTVHEVSDGRQVWQAVMDWRPDLILLDIMMPEMDGWETIGNLKSDAATKAIPVMIVSALAADTDMTRARNLGAFDYVTKPWSAGELVERVRWALVASKAA